MKAPWIKHALIGVRENTPLPADGNLGAFLQTITKQPEDAAQNFSLAVGAWAACRQAVFAPAEIDEKNILEFPAIPPESSLDEAHPAAYTLSEIFLSNKQRSICEALHLLEQQNIKLPSHLLSSALDAGRQNTEIRPHILKAIGLRGAWLARLNSNWKYAVTALDEHVEEHDERLWHEGNLNQREQFFNQCRKKDPARARTLLESELKNLPAKERLAFVEQLEIHLHADDEALLTSLLNDRSSEVKDKAAELLTHIPGSDYARQITGIMQTLVQQKKGLIRSSWTCDAPQTFSQEWKKLGLSEKPPSHYRLGGERSWWLFQLAVKTPLCWWNNYTGMSVHELAKWSGSTDWQDVLRHAWQESICTTDTEWIQILFEEPKLLETKHYSNLFAQLKKVFALLSDDVRVDLINRFPSHVCQNWQLLQMLSEGLPLHTTLPKQFSQSVLDTLCTDYKTSVMQNNYQKRHIYQSLIWAVHPNTLFKWQKPEKQLTSENAADIQWMQDIDHSIALRQKLHTQLSHLPSTTFAKN